jgi:hypothetical protein
MLRSLIAVTYQHNYYSQINLSRLFHSILKYEIILWVIRQTMERYLLYKKIIVRFMVDTNLQFQMKE